jgi:hypothetical protein
MPFPVMTNVAPTSFSERMLSNSVVFPSPLAAVQNTIARPGTRWQFDVQWNNRQGLEFDRSGQLDRLSSFLQGQADLPSPFWFWPRGIGAQTGSLDTDSLLAPGSGYLQDNETSPASLGWTVLNGLVAVNAFRIVLGSVCTIEQQIAVSPGFTYALSFDFRPNTSDDLNVRIGTTSGGTDVANATLVGEAQAGRSVLTFVPTTSAIFLQFRNPNANSRVYVSSISLAPAATVEVAATEGARDLFLETLPNLGDRELLLGSWLEVNGQLCRLRDDLEVFNDNTGTVQITPGLHRAAEVGDPVIFHRPACLVQLGSLQISRRRGGVADISAQLNEYIPPSSISIYGAAP